MWPIGCGPRSSALPPSAVIRVLLLALLLAAPAQADEIGDALEAAAQAQRAARESQTRINKLDDEARALQEKRRAAQWRGLQLSAYAKQLEQEAAAEEGKRSALEAQLARIKDTEKDLMPLMLRMVAELDAFVGRDLPFLAGPRRQRVAELKTLLADPARGISEKYRRVMEAYRTEVDYGHSLGAEETTLDFSGRRQPVSLVRIGRVGLYYLSEDRTRAGVWDAAAGRWQELAGGEVKEVERALLMAQSKTPPELLVLPVKVAQ